MTNSTVHGGQKCLTQGAAYNILGTVPGVHVKRTSLSTNWGINLKGKVHVFIQIVVSKICTIS